MNKQNIVRMAAQLYDRGYVVADDGNISLRIDDGYYVTAAGTYFSRVTETQIVKVGKDGEVSGENYSQVRPTSELAMHMEVYRQREDVSAAIHAHAPYSTAFSLLGGDKIDCLLTEINYTLGQVPIAPFARPGTKEVPESIRDLVKKFDGIILSNHGVLTLGKSLDEAYWNLERVEHFAKICYLANTLDSANLS